MSNPRIQIQGFPPRYWLMLKLAGTEFFSHNLKLYCALCGSRVFVKSLIRRKWKYTACPSCEGYTEYMVEEGRRHRNDCPGCDECVWPL